MSRLRLIPVVTSSLPYQHGFFPMSLHFRVGSISAFKQNTISEHFTCSFCILKAQSLWIIDLDLILAPRHQCCSCLDLIAGVKKEISPITGCAKKIALGVMLKNHTSYWSYESKFQPEYPSWSY